MTTESTRRRSAARCAVASNDVGRYARQLIAEIHALAGDATVNRDVAAFRGAVVGWVEETT